MRRAHAAQSLGAVGSGAHAAPTADPRQMSTRYTGLHQGPRAPQCAAHAAAAALAGGPHGATRMQAGQEGTPHPRGWGAPHLQVEGARRKAGGGAAVGAAARRGGRHAGRVFHLSQALQIVHDHLHAPGKGAPHKSGSAATPADDPVWSADSTSLPRQHHWFAYMKAQ